MRDIKTWLIIGMAIVIVLLILFQPSKPDQNDTRKYDSLIRVAREGEAKALELAELRKADSLQTIQTKQVYEVKILKLNRRLKSINTSKATDKQLDSLIMVLYGE